MKTFKCSSCNKSIDNLKKIKVVMTVLGDYDFESHELTPDGPWRLKQFSDLFKEESYSVQRKGWKAKKKKIFSKLICFHCGHIFYPYEYSLIKKYIKQKEFLKHFEKHG